MVEGQKKPHNQLCGVDDHFRSTPRYRHSRAERSFLQRWPVRGRPARFHGPDGRTLMWYCSNIPSISQIERNKSGRSFVDYLIKFLNT